MHWTDLIDEGYMNKAEGHVKVLFLYLAREKGKKDDLIAK